MTDLEMTMLCAEAMWGEAVHQTDIYSDSYYVRTKDGLFKWDPLHDDALTMALVKKLRLTVVWTGRHLGGWLVRGWYKGKTGAVCVEVDTDDLNRAIVECVAKLAQSSGLSEDKQLTKVG